MLFAEISSPSSFLKALLKRPIRDLRLLYMKYHQGDDIYYWSNNKASRVVALVVATRERGRMVCGVGIGTSLMLQLLSARRRDSPARNRPLRMSPRYILQSGQPTFIHSIEKRMGANIDCNWQHWMLYTPATW